MGIDELVARIYNDAEKEARRIRDKVSEEKSEILKEADARAEEVYWKRFNAIKEAAEEKKKQRLAIEVLEARKVVLKEKRKLLDEVFKEAGSKIRSLSTDRYRDMLIGMLLDAARDSGGEVILSEEDRERLGGELVAAANREIAESGGKGVLELGSDTREIRGGFVLRVGGVEINNSIKSQIDSRREQMEAELVDALFGDGEGTEESRRMFRQ